MNKITWKNPYHNDLTQQTTLDIDGNSKKQEKNKNKKTKKIGVVSNWAEEDKDHIGYRWEEQEARNLYT